ncbi:hypothetical protein [Hydrogenophaga sp. RWCD_12]|uniref:hypothetical protein n=1 Tax=Hydrogenophaga sp. RWCD_12 TaxID=3391190 RepID=UPI003985308F
MSDSAPDPHKLCLACGLCCRGGWFATGELGQDELEDAKSAGLHVNDAPGQVALRLPCPKFLGGCCSIYDSWRPKVCGAYSCALLNKYMAGDVAEKEALNLVTAAVVMFDRIVAETGPMEGGIAGQEFLQLLSASEQGQVAGGRQLSPVAKMDVVALKVFFARHFRKPGDMVEPSATRDVSLPGDGD